jgi:SagB-type dehydrogenase family enzyme
MHRKRSHRKKLKRRASTLQPIALPHPLFKKRVTLAAAFERRETVRDVGTKRLSLQILSNLLWAAGGVNRADGPFGVRGRTAASASNSQEIDLYVAMKDGTYLYDPFRHQLDPVAAGDLRALAIGRGQHGLGAGAPVRLIYVADIDRLAHTSGYQEPGLHDPEIQKSYYYVDTGLMAENVYLFAASLGLAAWFHNCDKPALATKLGLSDDQRALFAQTVGYPAKKTRKP